MTKLLLAAKALRDAQRAQDGEAEGRAKIALDFEISEAETARPLHVPVNVVFAAGPGPAGASFVEVELLNGKSVRAGEWRQREDGHWILGPFFADIPVERVTKRGEEFA